MPCTVGQCHATARPAAIGNQSRAPRHFHTFQLHHLHEHGWFPKGGTQTLVEKSIKGFPGLPPSFPPPGRRGRDPGTGTRYQVDKEPLDKALLLLPPAQSSSAPLGKQPRPQERSWENSAPLSNTRRALQTLIYTNRSKKKAASSLKRDSGEARPAWKFLREKLCKTRQELGLQNK